MEDEIMNQELSVESAIQTIMGIIGEIQLEPKDSESETLPDTYRSHGSLADARVPIFIYNAIGAPNIDYFQSNYLLSSWLYR